MAGVNCWVFSYPTDVIKTRMQADGVGGVNRYRNTWHCYQVTKAEAGTVFNPRSAFWVGFAPTALRAFPGNFLVDNQDILQNVVNAITFTVVDQLTKILI